MTTIEEIPIDVSEEALPEPAVVEEPLSPIEEEAPAPKKRGRPPGAKNRAKPKVVVAKRKPRAHPPPPSDEEEEEEDEEPDTPLPRMRRTHSRASAPEYEEEVVDARSVAAEMLQMLSRRNADKHHAKRAKYASWFPNHAVC